MQFRRRNVSENETSNMSTPASNRYTAGAAVPGSSHNWGALRPTPGRPAGPKVRILRTADSSIMFFGQELN